MEMGKEVPVRGTAVLAALERIAVSRLPGRRTAAPQRDRISRLALGEAAEHGELCAQQIALGHGSERRARLFLHAVGGVIEKRPRGVYHGSHCGLLARPHGLLGT